MEIKFIQIRAFSFHDSFGIPLFSEKSFNLQNCYIIRNVVDSCICIILNLISILGAIPKSCRANLEYPFWIASLRW